MNKKRARLYAILLPSIALPLLATLLFFRLNTVEPNGKVTAFFHLYSSPVKEQLEQALSNFSHMYPEVELAYSIEPYLDMKRTRADLLSRGQLPEDHAVISSLIAADIPENSETSPGSWTGTEWKLYYNSEILSQLDTSEEDLQALSESGLASFLEALSPRLKPDQTLFAASSRYYIQWLSWLQHLELEQSSGRMPRSFSLENWQSSIDRFNSLVESGYVNQDHDDINEASTALRMFQGEALFTLATDSIYSIFLPGDRARIRSLSFPGSTNQGWFVGSGFYLTTTRPEKITRGAEAAARAFVEYLRSDEVISEILRTTGVKLHPTRTRGMLKEIPAMSDQVASPELQEIMDYIRN